MPQNKLDDLVANRELDGSPRPFGRNQFVITKCGCGHPVIMRYIMPSNLCDNCAGLIIFGLDPRTDVWSLYFFAAGDGCPYVYELPFRVIDQGRYNELVGSAKGEGG